MNIKVFFMLSTIILAVAFSINTLCRSIGDVNKCSDSIEAEQSRKGVAKTGSRGVVRLVNLPSSSTMMMGGMVSSYVAKGDLLYYSRAKTVGGVVIYFIVDSINFAGYEPCPNDPVFYSEEDLQQFVLMYYPGVKLKKCQCGCWEE